MSPSNPLEHVAAAYPKSSWEQLVALGEERETRNQREILEIAAIAADVAADSLLGLGLEPEANPQLLEAFSDQYPTVDLDSLVGASSDRLAGLANGVKGKYFEVLVRDRLNDRERVGDLFLEADQTARLADSPTQPGWDLEIVNDDGSVAEQIQLKATEDMGYIAEALRKYPDIRVAAPSDVENVTDSVIQTDITNAELEREVGRQFDELSETAIEGALDQTAEWAFDAVPALSAVVVGFVEGRAVLLGRQDLSTAMHRSARKLGRAAVFTTLGATLTAVGAGVVAVPTTVAARVAWGRVAHRTEAGEYFGMKAEELRAVTKR